MSRYPITLGSLSEGDRFEFKGFFVVIIYDHKRRVIIGHSPLVFRQDRGPTFVSGSSIGPDDAPRKPARAS